MFLYAMEFATMRAQLGDGRWLRFDVEFERQLLQVKFIETGEIQAARHCGF